MSGSPQPKTNPSPSWPAGWLNRIHHGDGLDLLAQLPDECVDLVVTSPPYNLRSGGRCRGWPGYDGYGDDRPHDEYVAWQQECLREMYRVIKPTGAIFYNHAPRIHKGVQWRHEDILEPFDVRQTVIWHRAGGVNHNPQYLSPSYEYIYVMAKPGFQVAADWTMGDVWKMQQEKRRWIPEVPAFPVQLPQNAIRATEAKIVLDCFMGSGTTAVGLPSWKVRTTLASSRAPGTVRWPGREWRRYLWPANRSIRLLCTRNRDLNPAGRSWVERLGWFTTPYGSVSRPRVYTRSPSARCRWPRTS